MSFGVIVEGRAAERTGGPPAPLAPVTTGEMALIDHSHWSAKITADAVVPLVVPSWVFRPFAMQHPESAYLLEMMVQRVRDAGRPAKEKSQRATMVRVKALPRYRGRWPRRGVCAGSRFRRPQRRSSRNRRPRRCVSLRPGNHGRRARGMRHSTAAIAPVRLSVRPGRGRRSRFRSRRPGLSPSVTRAPHRLLPARKHARRSRRRYRLPWHRAPRTRLRAGPGVPPG